jgi:hypothetical protein
MFATTGILFLTVALFRKIERAFLFILTEGKVRLLHQQNELNITLSLNFTLCCSSRKMKEPVVGVPAKKRDR